VLELIGALNFATMDHVARRLAGERPNSPLLILDFRRVPDITMAGARLLGENLATLIGIGVTPILSGFERTSSLGRAISAATADLNRLRWFELLDDAIEWAEDQVIYRHGGFETIHDVVELGEQTLLTGLNAQEIAVIQALSLHRTFKKGERIVVAGRAAASLFFLQSGMVSVKLPSGVRLASLGPGMEFGEMALIEPTRSADVWADTAVRCLELPLSAFATFRTGHPEAGHRVMTNLAALLSRRLILANAKVDLLSAY
jgi:glutaminase